MTNQASEPAEPTDVLLELLQPLLPALPKVQAVLLMAPVIATKEPLPKLHHPVFVADHMSCFTEHVLGLSRVSVHYREGRVKWRWRQVD